MLVDPRAGLRSALTAVVLGSALVTAACSTPAPGPAGTPAPSTAPSATTSTSPAAPGASPTAAPSDLPGASPTATAPGSDPTPTGPAGAPTAAPSSSGSAADAPDPTAPAAPVPADREDARDRLPAVQGALADGLRWSDGVRIAVVEVTQGELDQPGPGSRIGPFTSFRLRVTNESDEPLDLSRVITSLTYGRPPLQARPVYDEGAADFTGRLAPGDRASARYSFAVPASGRSAVALTVDLDARHGLATFRGDAR